ncbi:MAG: hypothetical protein SX243_04185 [Acidobacteriota bacterium]|nr:hypothetical protein [Acidobacteriota bacterium]
MAARSFPVRLIAVVNTVAALLHVGFWLAVIVQLRSAAPGPAPEASIPTLYGFGIADLLWSAPLLAASAVGLWRGRFWGWLLAQWCNVLYGYSLTVVFVRDFHSGELSPGGILFLPFALFGIWSSLYLWKHRRVFFD